MQKLKERGTNAVPPKKSASAYIIFGKEVSSWLTEMEYQNFAFIFMNSWDEKIEKKIIQNLMRVISILFFQTFFQNMYILPINETS